MIYRQQTESMLNAQPNSVAVVCAYLARFAFVQDHNIGEN